MCILSTSFSGYVIAQVMSLRDRGEAYEIPNPFFSAVRSFVVLGLAEVGFLFLPVVGVVEFVARGVIEGIIKTIAYFSCNPTCIASCNRFSEPLEESRQASGYFILASIFSLYLNLATPNLKRSFNVMRDP